MRHCEGGKRYDTAAVITVGCRLNQAESDSLRGRLIRAGIAVSPYRLNGRLLDLSTVSRIYINTCAVTRQAERSSLAEIRRACRLQPKPWVVVLGCFAEKAPERLKRIAGVNEVWTNLKKQRLIAGQIPTPVRSRALLKVQDGCDRHCGYCLVSYLRGKPVSLPAPQVVEQFQSLVCAGFQEIVLTGLNLGRYEHNGMDLAGLLNALLKKPGDFRIRLSSLEPDLFTERLLEMIADSKVCAHFHIPLQSGDDRILALMGRRYTVKKYDHLISQILMSRPDVCIGADVIVGFPGEDDESFKRTMIYLSSSTLSYFHVFPYSLRLGTPAAQFGDPIPQGEKTERVGILRQLSQKKRLEFARRFVGDVRQVIVEPNLKALTDNYLRLSCPDLRGKEYQPGRMAEMKIELAGDKLIGSCQRANFMEEICL